MSTHNVLPQLFHSGLWNFITDDVLEAEGITVQHGYSDEGTVRPAKLTWTLNNASDAYRPTNPASPLFGKIGRNTGCAVSVDGSVRGTFEASSYAPDQSPEFTVGPPARGRRWIAMEAEGVLRRIGQWTEPLRSPMYRQTTKWSPTTLRGYWPLEDARLATQLTNAYGKGRPGTTSGTVTFQAGPGPGGSDQVMSLADSARLSGRFASMSQSAGWQLSMAFKLATLPGATPTPLIQWRTSNGYLWSWEVSSTNYRVLVTNTTTGVVLKDTAFSFGTGAGPTSWIQLRMKVTVAGGTVTIEPAWYPEGAGFLYGVTDSFAGTAGALEDWTITGAPALTDALYGHVFGLTTGADDLLSYAGTRAFDGYRGERAGERFLRLCGELGLYAEMKGTTAQTIKMGPQPIETFLGLIEEISRTEDALIFDLIGAVGLGMRTRADRLNQTPAMILSFPNDIHPPMLEVVDDLNVGNQVTVRQRDGAESTSQLEDGSALSISAPPDGIGLYKRTVDVNVQSESLLSELSDWWLSRSTVAGSRYPSIVIDLDDNTGFTAAINAIEIGDQVIVNGREPDLLRLLIIGWSETVRRTRRIVTFVCVPAQPFVSGNWDGVVRRWDSASTTLAASATAAAPTLALTTTNGGDTWSTTPGYDLLVAGERVTVTAMTAPAGAGPYTQTATVTRAVNGIVKAQTAGAQVHVFDPGRWAPGKWI